MSKQLKCNRCKTEVEVGEKTTEVLCTDCTQITYEEWLIEQNREKDYYIGDKEVKKNDKTTRQI